MIEPIRLSFEVRCPQGHAFETWTARTTTWWPLSHTVSGVADLEVRFEPRVGGRIYERTPSGDEHDWGRIVAWEPPHRLAYRWHLKVDPAEATEVEIRFIDAGAATTRVEIEHRGWEVLGEAAGQGRRDANGGGWASLLPHFVEEAERSRMEEPT